MKREYTVIPGPGQFGAWFHVNGMPVYAKSKADAVQKWKAGTLIKIHAKPSCDGRIDNRERRRK
jgi:hypothetical protein